MEFKVFKISDDVLGKARVDYMRPKNMDKHLTEWNSNFNDRLLELESYCKKKIPQKFNETIRNRGILAQEIRVLESNINAIKLELDDFKSNPTFKLTADNFFKTERPEAEGVVSPSVKQAIEEKFKNLKKTFEREFEDMTGDHKSLEMQLVKLEKEVSTKVDKSYIDTLEASLNSLIKQSKGSNNLTSVLKDLTEDILTIKDRIGKVLCFKHFLEFNSEKYDSCMEDFDRRITKYDEESQRFLDEFEVVG